MRTSGNNIKKVAKDIVMAYVHHIKDKVKTGEEDYIELGIDDDFKAYESLFRSIFSKVLGVQNRETRFFPNLVVVESLEVVEKTIKDSGYDIMLGNKAVSDCVFEVCMHILKKVKEDEFDELELEVL